MATAGGSGTVAVTRDGEIWYDQVMDSGTLLMDICFGKGRFVAVGLNGGVVYSDLVAPPDK